MWKELELKTGVPVKDGLLLDWDASRGSREADAPELPLFVERSHRADYGTEDLRSGFTIDLDMTLAKLDAGQTLVDNRTAEGKGFLLKTVKDGTIEIVLNDGRTENVWTSDPDMVQAGKPGHVSVIVDGGPKIISFVVDGKFCDGGTFRQFGWGRYSPNLRSANGGPKVRIGDAVSRLRIYGRALRTAEAIQNYRGDLR
jgi:hypothetical protein